MKKVKKFLIWLTANTLLTGCISDLMIFHKYEWTSNLLYFYVTAVMILTILMISCGERMIQVLALEEAQSIIPDALNNTLALIYITALASGGFFALAAMYSICTIIVMCMRADVEKVRKREKPGTI